jgi:LemA protein
MAWIILLGTTALVLTFIVFIYNSLVKNRILVEEAWSGIEVQLKRRHDLIPNLVETVKGYSSHEKETLEAVISMRSKSQTVSNVQDKANIEQSISSGIGRLLAIAESYPELKADANFRQLQEQLGSVEDEIQSARRYYNGATRNYNLAVQTFPNNLIAGLFSFKDKEFFEVADNTERQTPSVKF